MTMDADLGRDVPLATRTGQPTFTTNPQYASILATYDQQVTAAQAQLQTATQARDEARKRVEAVDPNADAALGGVLSKAAQDAYNTTLVNAQKASEQLQTAYNNQAQGKIAIAKATESPQEKAKLENEAKVAQFNAQKVENDAKEADETRSDRIAAIRAQSAHLQAQANVAQAQADIAGATTQEQIQTAQVALQDAQAKLQTTQAQAAQAPRIAAATATGTEADARIKEAQAAVASATTSDEIAAASQKLAQLVAGTRTAAAGATVAEAAAAVAPEKVQADLSTAQANAQKAALEVRQLEANLNATTDADRREAIQNELASKRTALQMAQTQLDVAQRTADTAVAQAGANVESTKAGTQSTLEGIQKNQLGTLYGVNQRIGEISRLIASGQIDPAQGNQLLQDHISTAIQGTTPFELGKFTTQEDTTRRNQDVSLATSKMSDYTSATTNLYNTFSGMNATVAPGSDVAGRGLMAALNMVGDKLGQYGNVPNPPMSPLLQSMRPSPAAGAVPQMAMAQPQAAPSPGGGVTINIGGAGGGGAAPAPSPAPSGDWFTQWQQRQAADTAQQQAAAGMPQMLQGEQPATPDHVASRWEPDLVQEAMGRMTAADAQARVGG